MLISLPKPVCRQIYHFSNLSEPNSPPFPDRKPCITTFVEIYLSTKASSKSESSIAVFPLVTLGYLLTKVVTVGN